MTRPFNFSPGPATLPEPVLRHAAEEMLDWHGTGMSVTEMSHRSKEFMSIYHAAQASLRELLAIPDDYKLLFLQGGAIGQNAIVPMNLLRGKTRADYVNTGDWSKRSIAEIRPSRPYEIRSESSTCAGRPLDMRPATYFTNGEYARTRRSRARSSPSSL